MNFVDLADGMRELLFKLENLLNNKSVRSKYAYMNMTSKKKRGRLKNLFTNFSVAPGAHALSCG